MPAGIFRWAFAAGMLPGLAAAADLAITVTGVKAVGAVRMQAFTEARGFITLENGVAAVVLSPLGEMARVTLHDLPPGPYAVAVFQDINGNQRLDTGLFGQPIEPYAISGQASELDFPAAAVEVGESGATLRLRLQ